MNLETYKVLILASPRYYSFVIILLTKARKENRNQLNINLFVV